MSDWNKAAEFRAGSVLKFPGEARKLTIPDVITLDLKTGEMEFHQGYTPSAAAKEFWSALQLLIAR